ncbi:MAG: hypothetical protein H0X30_17190 [Anaerolineae bacterium]|nr:hypothetical protein [Anaerolineae bacterium]
MSSFFHITPYEPWTYQGESLPDIVHEIKFISEIKLVWPEIQIWETPAYGRAAWELNYDIDTSDDEDCMQGMVNKDGQLSVNARGSLVTFAKLAIWYRSFIPTNQKLYMWWDTNVKPFELTNSLNVDQFVNLDWWT